MKKGNEVIPVRELPLQGYNPFGISQLSAEKGYGVVTDITSDKFMSIKWHNEDGTIIETIRTETKDWMLKGTSVKNQRTEENAMGEGQSRYGIMEELNNRKINEKEKLANIERETDQNIYNKERDMSVLKKEVEDWESRYEITHKDREREIKVQISLTKSEYDRKLKELEENLSDETKNYKSRFQLWKKEKEDAIKHLQEELTRYKEVQTKKIDEKKGIINEIENGINSLKEMSKEHKEAA